MKTKKLFLASASLIFFALSIILFQVSCKKDATAQTNAITGQVQINKIIYVTKHGNGSEIWVANYDGTNRSKVDYHLPLGLKVDYEYAGAKLSPDGKKVFFSASNEGYGQNCDGIYSCNIDGSNTIKIIDHFNSNDSLNIGGAY